MKKIHLGTLILCLAIPVLTGVLSATITSSSMKAYASMNKPPLSPPAIVFPIAWTILYLMMGLALYLIVITPSDKNLKGTAVLLFTIQLIMNFMWSIIFFKWGQYLAAFIWLIIMLCILIICAFRFYDINRSSAYLLIPYIVWLIFASYLNMGSFILN